ncbi:hypothetical protein RF55_24661, partial [Lasius niger]
RSTNANATVDTAVNYVNATDAAFGLALALDAQGQHACLLGALHHHFGNGFHMPCRGAGGNKKTIGNRCLATHVDLADVLGL